MINLSSSSGSRVVDLGCSAVSVGCIRRVNAQGNLKKGKHTGQVIG